MTNRAEKFPLNFDARTWSIEEAVPWIFFGDSSEDQSWSQTTELAVGYVAAEVDDRKVSRSQSADFAPLQRHLRMLGVLTRDTSFTPLIWCRVAIQFWLKHGGRQEKFISAMTQWVETKNKGSVAVVNYKNVDHPNGREIPFEVFLLGNIGSFELLKAEWVSRSLSGKSATQVKEKSTSKRSAESQVGSNLLSAVKAAVQDLKNSRQGRKKFLKTPDPATGRFRFIGLRAELYEAIHAISPDISRKRLLKNGKTKKAYAQSSVIKAISTVAICRRSWA